MRIESTVVCALSAIALLLSSPVHASGALKITSFPSGAQVIVDGMNTGKITPMSVSLAEGDHTVTVQMPASGWNADTRTVTIVSGNNDLSVTLLPVLTIGPPGPKGDKGDTGPAGSPGAGPPPPPPAPYVGRFYLKIGAAEFFALSSFSGCFDKILGIEYEDCFFETHGLSPEVTEWLNVTVDGSNPTP